MDHGLFRRDGPVSLRCGPLIYHFSGRLHRLCLRPKGPLTRLSRRCIFNGGRQPGPYHPTLRNTCLIALGVATTLLSSCIVGTTVAIHNRSKEDKNIQAFYPAGARLPFSLTRGANDSLRGYDHTLTEGAITSRDYYRYPVKIPLAAVDTALRTFAFTLKRGHQVVLEEGYPSFVPQLGAVFIVNRKDTAVLEKKGRFFQKRPKRGKGGSWTYTITGNPS